MSPEFEMTWDELQDIWDLPGRGSVRSTSQGLNNLTQIVETPAGNYILRAYDVDRPLEHIGYELTVLRELGQMGLPFRIPAPIPTATDELFAIFSGRMITLTPSLPGLPPQGDNLEQAQVAGQALAELVKALADLQIDTTFGVVPFPPSGDFETWGKIDIGSVRSIIRGHTFTNERQSQILTLIERAQDVVPSLYGNLPVQIIHRDYDQSNILMDGNSVTGVLDFEFCGPDLRILDLAYALSQWPSGWWNAGKEWNIINTFARGYLQNQRLTPEELEMLPLVFRLRTTTSLFYRFGRFARDLETSESMRHHLQESLDFELWLDHSEKRLMHQIRQWSDS